MSSDIHQQYQFGRASTKEPAAQQVSVKTIGVIAAVVIAVLALMNAYGNLYREISEGDLRVRQTILETERVLRAEIGSVREEVQDVRREMNANYRELRDLVDRSIAR